MDHLRFAGLEPARQLAALRTIVRGEPVLMTALSRLREMALNDSWMVAGAIYNTVWNSLTGRAPMTGVKDIDVFYFDDGDLSYAAEDAVIRRAGEVFSDLPVPVEVRNQARVHVWFEDRFGTPLTPLGSSMEMLGLFAARAHAVAVRLGADGELEVVAPFGLDDIFSFCVVPNPALDNRAGYNAKTARAKSVWPELTVVPWPGSAEPADGQAEGEGRGGNVDRDGERAVQQHRQIARQ